MKAWGVITLLLMASCASAYSYTGICFLDALLQGLDSLSATADNVMNPTTTTTSISTTTSTTESTTTSTTESTTTTSTTSTTSTSTTLFQGKCGSVDDCPEKSVTYTCDQDNNIIVITTTYSCRNAGTPSAECIGHNINRIDRPCNNVGVCHKGLDYCVKP